jgi:hypothetical protein
MEHIFCKRVRCYFAHIIDLDANLLWIQIYCCKANYTIDTTLHVLHYFPLHCFKYSLNVMSQSTGYHFCLVFGRSLVQITSRRPATLTEVFVIFLSRFRQILGQYLKLGHSRFLSRPFQFIIHKPSCHLTLFCLNYWQHCWINHK